MKKKENNNMRSQILRLIIFIVIFSSCKQEKEYCTKEINKLTNIILPKKIEIIECDDNLEYQFVFEYQMNDLSEVDTFIRSNNLVQYSSQANYDLIKNIDVMSYVGEFFEPNKIYEKSNEMYYVQTKNYSLVLDSKKGKFMGVVEY
ncbi:hypothetical protein [Ulvibacterium marinum]|uniref:Uncharacterized protein n=1 Tax=Ulvibacterium marinum TaxID=2419782 RepID=A0A3B0BYC3_9FLAO|nr:hypothetical protein [Ulvibacterium marinum]RKN76827.1 hypothetical protein D7Z94_23890 [Ulvibacterium marinum]